MIPKNIPCCNFILLSPNKYLSNRNTLIGMFLLTSHIFYFVKVQDTLQLFLFLPYLDSFYLSMQIWWISFMKSLLQVLTYEKIRAFMIIFTDLVKEKVVRGSVIQQKEHKVRHLLAVSHWLNWVVRFLQEIQCIAFPVGPVFDDSFLLRFFC